MTSLSPRIHKTIVVAGISAAGAALVADLLTPRSIGVHMFYVLPILLSWFVPVRGSTVAAAGLAIVLTLVGLWGAPGNLDVTVIADHLLAIAMFIPVAALVMEAKRLQQRHARDEDELRRSDAKMRAVFQSLAEGVVFVDLNGRVVEANEASRKFDDVFDGLTGAMRSPRSRTVRADGTPFPAEDQPVALALRSGRPVWNVEVGVQVAGGEEMWRVVNAQPVHDATGQTLGAVASFFDITDQKRTERALREGQARLEMALEGAAAGAWQWFPGTNEVVWDERLKRLYGFDPDAASRYDAWEARLHADDRDRVLGRLREMVNTPGDDELNVEFRTVRADGEIVWIHALGRAERLADGQVARMMGINLDVTSRKLTEEALRQAKDDLEQRVQARTRELRERAEQLRRLASDLTRAEQLARERLSQTLHDGLQQLLYGIRLQVDRLVRSIAKGVPPAPESLERVGAGLDEAISATRSLSIELSPAVLRSAGLAAALEWLVDWVRDRYRLEVRHSIDAAADALSEEVRILVFESVRELLFNVAKHAGVTEATLELALRGDDELRVTVVDCGAGMDPEVLRRGRSLGEGRGLSTIRERLDLLGGRLEIDSVPGRGARIDIVAPRRPRPDVSTNHPAWRDASEEAASVSSTMTSMTRGGRPE